VGDSTRSGDTGFRHRTRHAVVMADRGKGGVWISIEADGDVMFAFVSLHAARQMALSLAAMAAPGAKRR